MRDAGQVPSGLGSQPGCQDQVESRKAEPHIRNLAIRRSERGAGGASSVVLGMYALVEAPAHVHGPGQEQQTKRKLVKPQAIYQ